MGLVVWSEDGLRDISSADAASLRGEIVQPCLTRGEHVLGRGVLRYWFAPGDADNVTGWVYEFFSDIRFVAFTSPDIPTLGHNKTLQPSSRAL